MVEKVELAAEEVVDEIVEEHAQDAAEEATEEAVELAVEGDEVDLGDEENVEEEVEKCRRRGS